MESLPKFAECVFAGYRSRVVVVTTPNAEFNVHFSGLNYGKSDSIFRDADHKFEWTRMEFESW